MISAMEIYVCDKKLRSTGRCRIGTSGSRLPKERKNDKNSVENSRRHFAEFVSRPETAQIICRMQSGCVRIPA